MREAEGESEGGRIEYGDSDAGEDSSVVVCLHEAVNGQGNIGVQSGGAEESEIAEKSNERANADFIQDEGVQLTFAGSSDGGVLGKEVLADHGNRTSLKGNLNLFLYINKV